MSTFRYHLKALAPAVALVWVLTLLGAGTSMLPALRALPKSWDDQFFAPGGLMLLESLRLHRVDFLLGLKESLLFFGAMQLFLLLGRARLTAVLVDTARGQSPREALLSKSSGYVLVSLAKLVTLGLSAVLFAVLLSRLPSLEGQLPPRLTLLYGLLAVAGMLWAGGVVCVFDLYRIGLFVIPDWRARFHASWVTFQKRAVLLLARRVVWTVVSVAAGALTFRIASRPILGESTGPLATFFLSQLLVLLVLTTEVWWLYHAQLSLRENEAKGANHSETA